MQDRERDDLDRLIDSALPAYSKAEPLEGLEQRVLRRIHARRRRLPWWGIAVPALAACCVLAVLLWPQQEVAQLQPRLVASKPAAPQPAPVPQPVRIAKKQSVRVHALPKLARFPMASPLTPEERVLASWAARDPQQAVKLFSDLRQRTEAPVVIAAIEIRPLETDGPK